MISSDVHQISPTEPSQLKALATSAEPARPAYDSLVAALEASARDDEPYLTLYLGKEPTRITARAALEGARRQASLLHRCGVKKGDRVVVLTPTSPLFVETFFGANLLGAVPVPLASPMTFGGLGRYLQNLASIIENSEARVIVTSQRMKEAIAQEEGLRERLQHVLCESDVLDGNVASPALTSISASDSAFIQYTSGTTGKPKGAVISHRALLSNTSAIARALRLTRDDHVVSWLPLFHDMGLIGVLLTTICHPAHVHIIRPEAFLMKPSRWIELISQHKGTLAAAPNFAYDLCVSRAKSEQEVRLDSWRAALNGAEAVYPTTVSRFIEHYADKGISPEVMMPVYGMAESTLAITFPKLDNKYQTLSVDRALLDQRGKAAASTSADAYIAVSVGYPVAATSVRVTGSNSQAVDERIVGEIMVKSPSLMDGYFHNEKATSETISDGWLHTGDLGFMDNGRLFVVGRAKEVIIKGGRNIYPYDVEQIASEVSGVHHGGVAAFARPNPTTGTDDLVVMAETREKDPELRERIVKEIRGELLAALSVKVDDVQLGAVGSLPRTTSGKIRRRECALQSAQKQNS
ncbi:MAG: fatty acyl-AMP ligase [Deltaproteobacteria bacterium]|nr:fatty acyl-AMP ligase [Deltaproteobacteria bacterium]